MEARSLTSLNNLAANPPQYPINPAEEKQDPLTLYISRVPGTRDVILSPFKPQLKNVTGEDVASSLYYVHLEMHYSDLSNPPPIRDDGHRSSSDAESPTTRTIPRKPLPGSARPLTPELTSSRDYLPIPSDPPRRRGLSVNAAYDTSRPTAQWPSRDYGLASNEITPEPKSRPIPELRAPFANRPLGPRPMTSPPTPGPPAKGPQAKGPAAPGLDKALPPLPLQTGNEGYPVLEQPRPERRDHATNATNVANATSRSPSPRKFAESSFSTPFTLTLIRRDPSTGNQWNVGRISSYQMEAQQQEQDESAGFPSVTSAAPPPVSSGRPPINIQLETLGYAKFRHMPAKRSIDASPGGIANAIASMRDTNQQPPNDGTFSRQVVMGYSKSWASNFKEKLHQMDGRSGHGHSRHGSVASTGSAGSAGSAEDVQDVVGLPGPGMKPRGYVFASPWDGRCEFRTGNGGRSVRCYHILHDDNTSSFNPLVGGPGATGPIQGGQMPVSELRFNLPSTELFKTPEGRRDAKDKIQGHFNKFLKLGNKDESDEDDGTVSPFDMNLGREKAGGGNRGKRAKLGKLIIYNDGLKMLDLVVASNIGIWWGAWERSF
ncbi:Fc.00g011920.m01.CDS01 [Cosmosporella sp. VM-42]